MLRTKIKATPGNESEMLLLCQWPVQPALENIFDCLSEAIFL